MGSGAKCEVRFQRASDQSLIVYFDSEEERGSVKAARDVTQPLQNRGTFSAHESVRRLLCLLAAEPIPGARNLHPGYSSLLVNFDALRLEHEDLEKVLRAFLERMENVQLPPTREVEIPVCYGGEFGPDLEEVAKLHGILPKRVIELHAGRSYSVYFLDLCRDLPIWGSWRKSWPRHGF